MLGIQHTARVVIPTHVMQICQVLCEIDRNRKRLKTAPAEKHFQSQKHMQDISHNLARQFKQKQIQFTQQNRLSLDAHKVSRYKYNFISEFCARMGPAVAVGQCPHTSPTFVNHFQLLNHVLGYAAISLHMRNCQLRIHYFL